MKALASKRMMVDGNGPALKISAYEMIRRETLTNHHDEQDLASPLAVERFIHSAQAKQLEESR